MNSDQDYDAWGEQDTDQDNFDEVLDYDPHQEEKQRVKIANAAQKSFKVLDVFGICLRQNEMAQQISDLLSLSYDQAFAILIQNNWQSQKVTNQWFDQSQQKKLLNAAGIAYNKSQRPFQMSTLKLNKNQYCSICYLPTQQLIWIERCGHRFCSNCWGNFIKAKILDGPMQSRRIQCLESTCSLVIPYKMIKNILQNINPDVINPPLTSDWKLNRKAKMIKHHTKKDLMMLFQKYIAMSFTELNKFVRWCPKPNCQYAIESTSGSITQSVTCKCGQQFCLKCGKEKHYPVVCQVVKKWEDKNSSQSQNATWLIANTKQCPKCHKAIQKNQGCNHVTCRCGHGFCWMCLGPWAQHNSSTGGYYNCNIYIEDKVQQNKRLKASSQLAKYAFYFQRFKNHEKSQQKIQSMKPQLQENINLMNQLRKISLTDMDFLMRAINIIANSRNVLKWSYVYGFYIVKKQQRELLEFQQQKLEENAEILHGLIQSPFQVYLNDESEQNQIFYKFKERLTNLATNTEHVSKIMSIQFNFIVLQQFQSRNGGRVTLSWWQAKVLIHKESFERSYLIKINFIYKTLNFNSFKFQLMNQLNQSIWQRSIFLLDLQKQRYLQSFTNLFRQCSVVSYVEKLIFHQVRHKETRLSESNSNSSCVVFGTNSLIYIWTASKSQIKTNKKLNTNYSYIV